MGRAGTDLKRRLRGLSPWLIVRIKDIEHLGPARDLLAPLGGGGA